MANNDHKMLSEAYAKILGENLGLETPESNDSELNPELGSAARNPLSNAPSSEIKNAIKEIMRYKRPNYEISDEVIDAISDEDLRNVQDFLDKEVEHAEVSKVAEEKVDVSSYLEFMR